SNAINVASHSSANVSFSISPASLVRLVATQVSPHSTPPLHPSRLRAFHDAFERRMLERLRGHWYPDFPAKGSGYRSLAIYDSKPDPVLADAASDAQIDNFGKD
ncbi:hypothetical protein HK100_011322, partial [Physocladia obscura]